MSLENGTNISSLITEFVEKTADRNTSLCTASVPLVAFLREATPGSGFGGRDYNFADMMSNWENKTRVVGDMKRNPKGIPVGGRGFTNCTSDASDSVKVQ